MCVDFWIKNDYSELYVKLLTAHLLVRTLRTADRSAVVNTAVNREVHGRVESTFCISDAAPLDCSATFSRVDRCL